MVGGGRGIFYKRDGEKSSSTQNLRYKLEACQKNFLAFIYGSPTSTKLFGQDEETKIGPNGTTQEDEVQTKEPQDLKSGAFQKEGV